MIDITYNLSLAEFSEAYQLWRAKEFKKLPGWLLNQIVSVIFGGLVGWSFVYLPRWLTCAICVSMAANLCLYLWRKKATRKHQFTANSEFMEAVHVQIDETGYRSDKAHLSGSWIAWAGIGGWRESKNLFVLGRNLAFFGLPKSAMSSEQQCELRDLLQTHLGAPLSAK